MASALAKSHFAKVFFIEVANFHRCKEESFQETFTCSFKKHVHEYTSRHSSGVTQNINMHMCCWLFWRTHSLTPYMCKLCLGLRLDLYLYAILLIKLPHISLANGSVQLLTRDLGCSILMYIYQGYSLNILIYERTRYKLSIGVFYNFYKIMSHLNFKYLISNKKLFEKYWYGPEFPKCVWFCTPLFPQGSVAISRSVLSCHNYEIDGVIGI